MKHLKKYNEDINSDLDPNLDGFLQSLLKLESFENIFSSRNENINLNMITWACQKVRNMSSEELKETYESLRTNKGFGYDNNTLEDAILLNAINKFGDI